jgi:hypothetical protein
VSLKLIDSPTYVASLHNALLSTVTVWRLPTQRATPALRHPLLTTVNPRIS